MMNLFFSAVKTIAGDDETTNKFREAVIENKLVDVKKAIEEKEVDINADLSIGKLGNLSKYTPSYLKGLHSENSDSLEYRAIHWAARLGHVEMLDYLCTHEAKINSTNFIGNTPLHVALFYGQKECIKILLKHKAAVNIKNTGSFLANAKENFSPLHYAVMYGDKDDVALLIAEGANVMLQGLYNITPLFLAARFGNLEKVKLLLSSNNEVNISETQNGDTPLHSAIDALLNNIGSAEIVLLLLKNQANPKAVNKANDTPLEVLINNSSTEISSACLEAAAYLLQYGTPHGTFKEVIYKTNNIDFSLDLNKFLIERQSKQNLQNSALQEKEKPIEKQKEVSSEIILPENINTNKPTIDLIKEPPKQKQGTPPKIGQSMKKPPTAQRAKITNEDKTIQTEALPNKTKQNLISTSIQPEALSTSKQNLKPISQKIVNKPNDFMGDLFAAMKKRRKDIDGESKDWSDSDEDSKTNSYISYNK